MDAYWKLTADQPPAYPALEEDVKADVAIAGAGIAGLTAAIQLQQSGFRVVVLEGRSTGQQATGRSTGKLTSQHHLAYAKLIEASGREKARLYAEANERAIRQIQDLAQEFGISCGLEKKAAYIYAQSEKGAEALEEEAEAAKSLGLPAVLLRQAPLPLDNAGALCFEDQAQFNPFEYLQGLAAVVARHGMLFERSRVVKVEDGSSCVLHTAQGHRVTADAAIIATQLPTIPEGSFYTKAYPFSHTMIAAPLTSDTALEGMFITAEEPSLSFRTARSGGRTHVVAVGSSYRTGHADEEQASLEGVENFVEKKLGTGPAEYRWTNLDFRSMDSVPFVGKASSSSKGLYVATGFQGWGLTNGTVAGGVLADAILQIQNPVAALFDSTRVNLKESASSFVKENTTALRHLVHGRLHSGEEAPHPETGTGQIVEIDGEKVALFRGKGGAEMKVSAICTHKGCVVGWNPIDQTWDCPCHGSRFSPDGEVIGGPAAAPLPSKDSSAPS